ncbi:zinc-ribbon domain containing protein [Pseudomarimonas arenosa]|uniref:Zinc-ribbon domain containing protein n=1 Tax=Pseudomarimonas arenosa TaxID=2774145 RepID=A0AAW3ZUY3_9GAMM|nr:zinc-ribbon domain containing protein [Pseudomarimonas arenosa]MBD8527861.1 zinc-ribbon domain containing protein [Pseudomarimonas arenosa]
MSMHAKRSSRVDLSLWSEASRRSMLAAFPPKYYTDIHYVCYHCGGQSVFLGADQKITFEVKRQYVWQRRVLCERCKLESERLKAELRSIRKVRKERGAFAHHDRAQSERMLTLLQLLPKYALRKDTAAIRMLEKELGDVV